MSGLKRELEQAHQRNDDVVNQRVLWKQRDDLVGAGHPEMGALVRGLAGDVLAEDPDFAARCRKIAGDQIEQGRLAGTVGSSSRRRSPIGVRIETSRTAGRPPKKR